jgi:hypothetical protein
MAKPNSRVIDAILHLRASLDAVAAALAEPDVAQLTAAEASLAEALTEVGSIRGVERADRHLLAAEVIRARAALQRCRVLGAAATDATRATLAAQGRTDSYGRSGAASEVALRGLDFDTRI